MLENVVDADSEPIWLLPDFKSGISFVLSVEPSIDIEHGDDTLTQ
jgi:hypothetical protein